MKSNWFDLYLFLDFFVFICPKEIAVLLLCLELAPSTVYVSISITPSTFKQGNAKIFEQKW